MFGLVDCNNFYASCERVFRPELEGRPVVVLSNNDGCVIARSQEAKALGIRMAEPYFKVRELMEKHGVVVCSSNYELYGDMSRRVMWYLAQVAPAVEVYSIDEAFLDLAGMSRHYDLAGWAGDVRGAVRQRTGIPVGIGVAATKTLAKLANGLAKQDALARGGPGVLVLDDEPQRREALARVAVEDIWGVGRRSAVKLHAAGVRTAAQLAGVGDAWARKHLGAWWGRGCSASCGAFRARAWWSRTRRASRWRVLARLGRRSSSLTTWPGPWPATRRGRARSCGGRAWRRGC